ncbi:MAG: hypothetical protein AB1491_10715 [Thermodesulfobacteriota bacterium]
MISYLLTHRALPGKGILGQNSRDVPGNSFSARGALSSTIIFRDWWGKETALGCWSKKVSLLPEFDFYHGKGEILVENFA